MNKASRTEIPAQANAISLARELFGSGVRAVEPVARGVMNYKFKVRLRDNTSFAIRIYPPSRETIVEYEPDLLKSCVSVGMLVPEVIADSRSGPNVNCNYTVYRWIDGVPLDERLPFLNRDCLAQIATELLMGLRKLAAISISGYGDLVTAVHAQYSNYYAFVHETITAAPWPIIANKWGSKTAVALRVFCEKSALAIMPKHPVLAWGDISPENILLDAKDRIIGMIDFEGTLAGDFELSLGYCYARYYGTPFFNELRRIWPNSGHGLDDTIQFHAVLRGLRLARHADLPMPTGHARKPADQILPGFRESIRNFEHQILKT